MNIKRLPSNNIDHDNEPVVDSGVTVRKKKATVRIADDIVNISGTLFEEVVAPAIKTVISDFVSSGIELMLWGGREGHGPRRTTSRDYSAVSRRNTNRRQPSRYGRQPVQDRRRAAAEIDDIFFESRMDADRVLGSMYERIAEYGWCTVGDLYAFAGLSSEPIHERYGWVSIDGSRVRSSADGYYIQLPKPSYE